MTAQGIALTFPNASRVGGVERIVWEAANYFGPRHPTMYAGYQLERAGLAHVDHVEVVQPKWARGWLAPVGFRRAARIALDESAAGALEVSFGVNAPPGDVLVVNSVHRAWLGMGKEIRVGGRRVPNAARYALPRHQALLALEWDYFRRHESRALVAVSDAVVGDLERLYGVRHRNTVVIGNGYDPAMCNPLRRDALRAERRRELGIGDEALVLLFVANELHRKGFGVLLEALAHLDDPRLEVHVVGRMPPSAYAARITQSGLDDHVTYHGATDDIGLFHAIADVLVLPTQYEAFALTIVEALASGLPVVTTNIAGARDLVRHDVNGLIQDDPTDAAELARLLAATDDETARSRWGRAATETAKGYEWNSLMGRLEQVISGVA